jgi:hypothetical protein
LEANCPIHDLFIEKLELVGADSWSSLQAYIYEDHLLKRLGLIEWIQLVAGDSIPKFMRSQADELWTLIDGKAVFEWKDKRENSPTYNASHSLIAQSPLRLLVPFGVEFMVSAKTDCTLLRISSHAGALGEHQIQDSPSGA